MIRGQRTQIARPLGGRVEHLSHWIARATLLMITIDAPREWWMSEQMTCGKGLAENSVLPRKLGDLTAAIAKILEIHMAALDCAEENGKQEHDAYMKLVMELREIAVRLESTADHMTGYRDLPIATHSEAVMRDPKAVHAFERFVEIKQEVLQLLQSGSEQDRAMLAAMQRAEGTGSAR